MRVCFFNRSYAPDTGATGQLLMELAEGLVSTHGCKVSVVAGPPLDIDSRVHHERFGWRAVSKENRNGVEVFRAWGTRFHPGRLFLRVVNYVSYFLSACLASFTVPRCDVVISLTDPPIIGLIALLTARRFNGRFVFVCQDVFPEVAGLVEGFHAGILYRLLNRISRFLIHNADRVIAVGETMRERLIERKGAEPKKTVVIHNWADRSLFGPANRRNPFAIEHGLADAFVVMYSGNIGLSQTLETLLDAADRLKPFSEIVFVLIGAGVKREQLERQTRERHLNNVRFLPYQPKGMLRYSYATADVFVIPLKKGLAGFIVPSKLYGILAAGRPYVAAVDEDSEVASITQTYNCGLLSKPADPDDLAQKILSLYHDTELRGRLGDNGRLTSMQYDRPKQIDAYYKVFSELPEVPLRPGLPKRMLDLSASGFGLLISAPLWAAIALAIKIDDGGPIFYTQERVGQGGRRFKSYKFRSMIKNADEKFGPLQAQVSDHRVTRVGRLLRATAMDELPQLWNIFKGDMSFVGPRALRGEEIEVVAGREPISIEEVPGYDARHRIRPGLTGLAQVYSRRDLPRRQKFKLDLLYIRKRSFWLDLKLIALSFWISLRGRWEYTGKKL